MCVSQCKYSSSGAVCVLFGQILTVCGWPSLWHRKGWGMQPPKWCLSVLDFVPLTGPEKQSIYQKKVSPFAVRNKYFHDIPPKYLMKAEILKNLQLWRQLLPTGPLDTDVEGASRTLGAQSMYLLVQEKKEDMNLFTFSALWKRRRWNKVSPLRRTCHTRMNLVKTQPY